MPHKDKEKSAQYKHTYYSLHKDAFLLRAQKRRKKNQDFLRRYKRCGVQCMDCGDKRWQVLEFDHRDPKKKHTNIARMARNGTSLHRLKEEIRKCDVVCANCHRMRHNGCVWTENSYTLEVHIGEQTPVTGEVAGANPV